MKKNGFAPIIIILVIAILGVFAYLFYKNIFLTKNDIFSQVSSEISNTKNLDKHLIVSLSKNDKGLMFWYTQEDYLIAVPNTQQVFLQYNCDPGSGGGDLQPIAPTLVTNIAAVLKRNGFQMANATPRSLSEMELASSSDSFIFGSDNYFNEKTNLYCNLSVDLSCGGAPNSVATQNLYFTCVNKNDYDTNYSHQIKPLSDMGIKDSTLDKLSSYGDYYLFNEHGAFGPGAYLVAKVINSKWIKLFGGQDNPSCTTVDQYKVPHQLGNVLSQCYDSGGKLVNNPN